jgi:hypothetical protein
METASCNLKDSIFQVAFFLIKIKSLGGYYEKIIIIWNYV